MMSQNVASRLAGIEDKLSEAHEHWPGVWPLVVLAVCNGPEGVQAWERIPERHHERIRTELLDDALTVDGIAELARVDGEIDTHVAARLTEARTRLAELLGAP